MTPPPSAASISSAGLRKPRSIASGRSSPASFHSGPSTPLEGANPFANASKATVDTAYFSGLGQANASRPDNVKPSEGGRYQGFGSEPFTPSSMSTSFRSAPSLDELREDPMSALTKGWGLFSTALSQASKTVNE